MGRKAKDAAQQKIGEWTGSARRNTSTVEKVKNTATKITTTTKPQPAAAAPTTITNENANTSNENRSLSEKYSQSELNAMKNCSVVLEQLEYPFQQAKQQPQNRELTAKSMPAPALKKPSAVAAKENQTAVKKIYDYSFDDDLNDAIPLETGEEGMMKDLFDKLAKENKIVVKKYRPKNVKKPKANADEKEKPTKKAAVTRKRLREKQTTSAEQPAQKRPNLKNVQVTNIDGNNDAAAAVAADKRKVDTAPADAIVAKTVTDQVGSGILAGKKVTILEDILIKPKETTSNKITAKLAGRVNVLPTLKNRLANNFQSTPKSSTPLSTKTATAINAKDRSMKSLFFENVSPLNEDSTRSTRSNLLKQRLRLSAINDSDDVEASTSSAHQNAPDNSVPVQQMDFLDDWDDDGIHFTSNDANVPQPGKFTKKNKENSPNRPGSSLQTNTSNPLQPSTSAGLVQNRSGPSPLGVRSIQNRLRTGAVISSSRSNSTKSSDAGSTPQNSNNYSHFEMNDISDYHVYSPTKRRVYGRSPLKNIVSFRFHFHFNRFTFGFNSLLIFMNLLLLCDRQVK